MVDERGDGVGVADLQAEFRRAQEHRGEVLEQQRDGRADVVGIEVGAVALLLRAPHRCGDDVHAEAPELVLHVGESGLGVRELADGDHDADVLLEHVPVPGHHRREERAVLRRLREVHA